MVIENFAKNSQIREKMIATTSKLLNRVFRLLCFLIVVLPRTTVMLARAISFFQILGQSLVLLIFSVRSIAILNRL